MIMKACKITSQDRESCVKSGTLEFTVQDLQSAKEL